MREIPKVALLVETSRAFGRSLLMGVARYARLHGPWSFHITPGDFEKAVPKMKQWGGTGIIARIPNERIAEAVHEANVPTIALGLSDEQLEPDPRPGPHARRRRGHRCWSRNRATSRSQRSGSVFHSRQCRACGKPTKVTRSGRASASVATPSR